LQSVTY